VSHPSIEELRTLDLFEECSEEQLARWAQAAELVEVEAGTVIEEQGQPTQAVHLVFAGTLLAVTVDAAGREDPVSEHHPPTWIGASAAVTEGVNAVSMRALTPATLAAIPSDARLRAATRVAAVEQNRDRLASLGTMAAGLAHELNNPAAAARRAADDLAESLDVLSSTIDHFVESGVERAEAKQLVEIQRETVARQQERGVLGALDAADAEEALLAEMEELGVPEAWRLSEPLSAAGVDGAWLARVASLAGVATPAALRWMAASLTARGLANELKDSTSRMSELVGAVKSYAYMGRGEVVEADVHEGLETTLTILGHKLRHTSIQVERDYDRTLPRLMMHGPELNQVWTNLLDNAIDALGEQGTITLSTRRDGDALVVDIADDGPGIPAEARAHIFDPFFTTKGVGKGTGLGLDTARRIVTERQRGTLSVDSAPGRTVFHVRLPLDGAS
jgi:signal transduction histidine kinase